MLGLDWSEINITNTRAFILGTCLFHAVSFALPLVFPLKEPASSSGGSPLLPVEDEPDIFFRFITLLAGRS